MLKNPKKGVKCFVLGQRKSFDIALVFHFEVEWGEEFDFWFNSSRHTLGLGTKWQHLLSLILTFTLQPTSPAASWLEGEAAEVCYCSLRPPLRRRWGLWISLPHAVGKLAEVHSCTEGHKLLPRKGHKSRHTASVLTTPPSAGTAPLPGPYLWQARSRGKLFTSFLLCQAPV